MTPKAAVTYVGQNLSSELDTDHGKDIRDQLKFGARQMAEIIFLTDRLSNEYGDLPPSPGSNYNFYYRVILLLLNLEELF